MVGFGCSCYLKGAFDALTALLWWAATWFVFLSLFVLRDWTLIVTDTPSLFVCFTVHVYIDYTIVLATYMSYVVTLLALWIRAVITVNTAKGLLLLLRMLTLFMLLSWAVVWLGLLSFVNLGIWTVNVTVQQTWVFELLHVRVCERCLCHRIGKLSGMGNL